MNTSPSWRLGAAALLCAAAAAAAPTYAQAASKVAVATPWVGLHQARVRLVAGPSMGADGQRGYLAGVEVALADGWKTYWRMPGDAGVPPTFEWANSKNAASVKVLYPAPIRLLEPTAETIGYKGVVVFPVEVRPLDPTKPIELGLEMEIGICREICIPEEVKLSVTIPPDLAGTSPAAAWRERVPRLQLAGKPAEPELKSITAKLDGPSPRLLVEAKFPSGDKGGDLFIEAPDGVYVPMSKRLPDSPDGVTRFESDLSRIDAHDLKGKKLTVTMVRGDGKGGTEATWQLP